MRILLVLGLAMLLAVACVVLIQSRRTAATLAGRVTYVIDGDTVVVRLGSAEPVHVRLIGINTPEIAHFGKPGECFGIRATRLTRRLALGRQVVLRPGRERHDRYGRLLAYVRVLGESRRPRADAAGPRRRAHAGDSPQRRSCRASTPVWRLPRDERGGDCGAPAPSPDDSRVRRHGHADRGAACDGRAARTRPGLAAGGCQFPSLQRPSASS